MHTTRIQYTCVGMFSITYNPDFSGEAFLNFIDGDGNGQDAPAHRSVVPGWVARMFLGHKATVGGPPKETVEVTVMRDMDEIVKHFWQTSAAYRLVARVPEGKTALQALDELKPNAARRVHDYAERLARSELLRGNTPGIEQLELTIDEFRRFKELGGRVA